MFAACRVVEAVCNHRSANHREVALAAGATTTTITTTTTSKRAVAATADLPPAAVGTANSRGGTDSNKGVTTTVTGAPRAEVGAEGIMLPAEGTRAEGVVAEVSHLMPRMIAESFAMG